MDQSAAPVAGNQPPGTHPPDEIPLIEAVGISKKFRLQRERQRSLQESFIGLWRRTRTEADYFWPLRDFSIRVMPGDSIGILGQNGSGKSTLLKLLTGVLQPTDGEIQVNGRIASLLELGAGFHPDLTGRENIFLNASIYGMDNRTIRRNLESIIDFAEIGEFIDTPVKHYSSGMYVRLGFAVAVHTQPDVLIVDEVLTVGDQIFQQKCMQRIWELGKAGVALILVSHNLEDVRRLCDRAVWIHSGRVRADGPALDVVDEYLTHTNEIFYQRQRAEKAAADAAKQSAAGNAGDGNAGRLGDPQTATGTEATADATGAGKKLAQLSSDQRWGTHQAEIVAVELRDAQGEIQDRFRSGESLGVRIYYQTHERIAEPTFGLAIYRRDGVHINGPNSVDEGYEVAAIDGEGMMEYRVDALPLNPGHYELTVAIYNRNSTIAIDHHHRLYPFEVIAPGKRSEAGVIHLPASWHLDSGTTPPVADVADETIPAPEPDPHSHRHLHR